MSTTGKQTSNGEMYIFTTGSENVTTDRLSNPATFQKQRKLLVEKMWLPEDDEENKTFPDLKTFDFYVNQNSHLEFNTQINASIDYIYKPWTQPFFIPFKIFFLKSFFHSFTS